MRNGILGLLTTARNGGEPRRPWYSIRNVAEGEAEVFIYDYIGFDPFFGGVSAADFVHELREINATKILVRVNSPGGDIAEGLAIRNALIEHPARIETHVDGLAASTAGWCAMIPGEQLVMSAHAMLMIHEPYFFCGGDADYLRQQADILDKYAIDIAKMLQEKAGGNVDEWRTRMREETWYSDQEAVDAGLADSVASSEAPAENRYDPGILTLYKHAPQQLTQRHPRNDPTPPPAAPAAPERSDELVRAALVYRRDEARRQGVLV